MQYVRRSFRVALDAYWEFVADDAWALSSHIALSALMSMFPFLLVLTALAGIFGSRELADEAARIMLEAWPTEVSARIASEIQSVLLSARGDVLTIGALLALFFASSGVESLRVGLNRAYNVADHRAEWVLRLESIGYVLVAAAGLLVLSFFVLLAPLIWKASVRLVPGIEPFASTFTFARFAIATVVLIVALLVVHLWLPAGRRRLHDIWPGILVTFLLWIAAGTIFGRYLAEFAFAYSIYYAGLASPMIALVFLYLTAAIFIYGGELNAAITRARQQAPPAL